jgi:DNA-binding transcriptional regulator YhcF (GntR family)
MTSMTRPEPLTDTEIANWAADPRPAYRIAADIARSIKSGKLEPGAAIDSNNDLARRHDCSASAAASGKSLLVSRGLVHRQGQFYVVVGTRLLTAARRRARLHGAVRLPSRGENLVPRRVPDACGYWRTGGSCAPASCFSSTARMRSSGFVGRHAGGFRDPVSLISH